MDDQESEPSATAGPQSVIPSATEEEVMAECSDTKAGRHIKHTLEHYRKSNLPRSATSAVRMKDTSATVKNMMVKGLDMKSEDKSLS